MRFEQLLFLREIVDQGLSVTRAANVLNTSQPGVSKQIRLLEGELGFEILRRRKGRIDGVTEPGEIVVALARKILRDVQAIRRLGDDFSYTDAGELVIATTHLHARYVLPAIIEKFRKIYPKVRLSLLQIDPEHTGELVGSGRADIGITSELPNTQHELVELPIYEYGRSLVMPPDHPLLDVQPLKLQQISQYPIISYNASYPGGMAVKRAFEREGLAPEIVISATDAEVIKAYVRIGLGVAVVPAVAFDAELDKPLEAVDATDLFGILKAQIILHPETFLREYMYDFMQMVAPNWPRAEIVSMMAGADTPDQE
ncbi:MAG: LysR substrate-binding domain-containing protein [Alphaproteobacteria bacterium]